MAREFDFSQPYEIVGMGPYGRVYWIQKNRGYLPKRGRPPELVKEHWAQRTPGGGQTYRCKYCDAEFETAKYLGAHRKSTICGVMRKKERQQQKHDCEARKALKKILGAEKDVRDGQVKEEMGSVGRVG